jgi:hypothetical protein
MKKIFTITFMVLLGSTMMFAGGLKEGLNTASGFTVIRGTENNLFKVYYKSEKSTNVRLSIVDAKNKEVFSENFNKVDGFVRPYNFEQLPHGEYTIRLEDETSVQVEKISYRQGVLEKLIQVRKLNQEDSRYLVSVSGAGTELITLNIYDEYANRLLHTETNLVKDDIAKLYNLSKVGDKVTFEIVHASGAVRRLTF